MSNSVRPHRWQPTRLPCPWDSPGKNTGVGCHFLLQCMKVKSESEVAQSCPTLSDPMDRSLPGSSIHGIFQARVLEQGCTILLPSSSEGRQKKQELQSWWALCLHKVHLSSLKLSGHIWFYGFSQTWHSSQNHGNIIPMFPVCPVLRTDSYQTYANNYIAIKIRILTKSL